MLSPRWWCYQGVCAVLCCSVRPIPRALYCPRSSLLCHCYCVKAQAFVHYQTHWFPTPSLSLSLSLSCLPLSSFVAITLLFFPPLLMFLCWQQTKERVKLLIQLADGFCDKGHAHALEIKKWVSSVDKRYRDFSLRMDKYRTCLETALGISSDSNKAVSAEYWCQLQSFLFCLYSLC